MKVIFLDVDGVLNSFRNVVGNGGFPFPEETDGPHAEKHLDPIAIGMVRSLAKETGAQIVFESSWRKVTEFRRFAEFHDLEIVDEIPGQSQARSPEGGSWSTTEKCWCMLEWLEAHPEVIDWIVLDDDNIFGNSLFRTFMGEERIEDWDRRHVRTNLHTGMMLPDFARAFQVLENLSLEEAKAIHIKHMQDKTPNPKHMGIWSMLVTEKEFDE